MSDIQPSGPSPELPGFAGDNDLAELQGKATEIKNEIGRKLVGQHALVELLIAGLLTDGHMLIEGVPGIAKTLTAKLFARILDISFSRIQFTPDLMPSDITGTNLFNTKKSEFEFIRGPVFGNLILIDEINRAPAKTQAALFECMEERQVSVDGVTYPLDYPFIVLATQNPVEHEGTYKLPEAQLDRFLFKIEMDYPSFEEEVQILEGFSSQKISNDLTDVKPILRVEDLRRYRRQIRNVSLEPELIKYIARLIENTRRNPGLFLGASPRASIGILNSSKAMAALHGRNFVIPEDIRSVLAPVLLHRIVLTPEREMAGNRNADVINEIIHQVEVPR